jgi:uncharacterized membrane protein YkoI
MVLVAGAADVARAGDRHQCLGPEQRRAAIASHRALPLARVIRMLRPKLGGEVVKARLCEESRGLVYTLTVLGRDGKVTRVAIDAATGNYLGRR